MLCSIQFITEIRRLGAQYTTRYMLYAYNKINTCSMCKISVKKIINNHILIFAVHIFTESEVTFLLTGTKFQSAFEYQQVLHLSFLLFVSE